MRDCRLFIRNPVLLLLRASCLRVQYSFSVRAAAAAAAGARGAARRGRRHNRVESRTFVDPIRQGKEESELRPENRRECRRFHHLWPSAPAPASPLAPLILRKSSAGTAR